VFIYEFTLEFKVAFTNLFIITKFLWPEHGSEVLYDKKKRPLWARLGTAAGVIN